MAADVAPELLAKVQDQFNAGLKSNRKITAIYNKIQDGEKLTYVEANDYAQELGAVLATAFKRTFSADALPDGKMYYNIADRVVRPMLKGNYELVASVSEYTQNSLNKAVGIGLKAVTADLNESRVQGLVDKVSSYDSYNEAAWVLDEPVVNFSQSVVDDFIQANVEMQYNVGFSPQIERRLAYNCCEWCAGIAGKYDYPKGVPPDFYRRHERCRCTIIYEPSRGKFQGANSKRNYKTAHEAEINERRLNLRRDTSRR